MNRLNLLLFKHRVRRATGLIKGLERAMIKAGMSRQVRRAYWRDIAKNSEAREALLERMEGNK